MLDIQNIPLDDQKTWNLIKSGRTGCVFQLESHLGKHWCKKIRPSNIEELSAVISLVRPGCLNSYSGDPPKNMAQRYADRKNGLEKIEYYHESLEPMLNTTLGVLCIHEDTFIATTNGIEKPIKYINPNDDIISVNQDTLLHTKNKCLAVCKSPKTHGVRLVLSNGFTIILTDDHEVRTQRGYIKVKDLDINNDIVQISRKQYDINKTNSYFSFKEYKDISTKSINLSYLLGQLIGDGHLGRTIASGSTKNHNILFTYLKENFPKLRIREYFHVRSNYIYISSVRRNPRKTAYSVFIEDFGLNKTKNDKIIVDKIFMLSPKDRRAFLAGLFDADGYSNQDKTKRSFCTYCSSNPQIINSVRKLLSMDNIDSFITKDGLHLHIINTGKFKELVEPFILTKKIYGTLTYGDRIGYYPHKIIKDKILHDFDSIKDCCNTLYVSKSHITKRKQFTSCSFAEKCGINFGEIAFMKIHSITPIDKKQQFYSISVSNDHNLIGNGIVIKNCYQEQTMAIASKIAGFTPEEANQLRKCIAKNSIVYTDTGPIYIQDLINKQNLPKILTFDKNGQSIYRQIKKVWSSGIQKVYRVQTTNGYFVDVTKNHQIFTQRGWVETSNLLKGDFIVIPKKYNFNKGVKTSIDRAIWFAYFLAEGCYTNKSEPKITNSDPWIINKITQSIDNDFGNHCYYFYKHQNGCIDIYLTKDLRRWIINNIEPSKSRHKVIPSFLKNSRANICKAFVGSFFSAEGSVNKGSIDISSTSIDIICNIQTLLLREGIHSSIITHNSKYNGQPYISYRLVICENKYIHMFKNVYKEYICPTKLNKLINFRTVKHNNSKFLVPDIFVKSVAKINNYSCILGRSVEERVGGSRYNKPLTYETVSILNQYIGSKLFSNILSNDFYFVKVKEIKQVDDIETYDFEICGNIHNGVINGILVHNSIGKKNAQLMSELKSKFIDGCKKVGIVNDKEAEEIFSWIEASNRYAFNRSHGIEYAINSYRTAYCKANYPLEFYCSYLLGCKWKQDSSESIKELVIDAREFGVEFGLPTILDKQKVPYVKNNRIYFGISLIRDIGDVAQEKLLNCINNAEKQYGPITTWSFLDTLIYLCDNVTNKVFEALIYSGSLDHFGLTRNRMFFEYEKLRELTKKELENLSIKHKEERYSTLGDALISLYKTKKEGGICHSKKRSEFIFQLAESILHPNLNLNDSIRFLSALEKKYLGISISCMEYDGSVQADISNLTCKDIANGHGNINIYLCAEVISIKEIKIKKEGNNFGKKMGILSIFDMSGSLDSIFIFPELYEEIKDNINEGDSIFLMIDRSKRGGYICTSVEKI